MWKILRGVLIPLSLMMLLTSCANSRVVMVDPALTRDPVLPYLEEGFTYRDLLEAYTEAYLELLHCQSRMRIIRGE